MGVKKNLKQEVELVLRALEEKIDSLQEKVEKLCENTDCWGDLDSKDANRESKKD